MPTNPLENLGNLTGEELLQWVYARLVADICEDLRSGRSPYPRLFQTHDALYRNQSLYGRNEVMRFVERIFGVILGASDAEVTHRLRGIGANLPRFDKN